MAFRPRLIPLALTLLALGACADKSQTLDVDVVGDPASPFASGVRIPYAAQLVRQATTEGLVALDMEGRVIPALADRWIVTDDGLSFIFRLRDGTWPDGAPLTGENTRAALVKALAALGGTPLARDFGSIAEVRAMAGRVIEIRLSRPAPDLLDLLAQPELGLTRGGQATGPMRLKREARLAALFPVPSVRRGLPADPAWDRARIVRLHALPIDAAAKRFSDGTVAVVLGGRFETLPEALAAAGLTRRALRLDPVSGLFGLAFANQHGLLAQAATREALAMAIDRPALAGDLRVRGWLPLDPVNRQADDETSLPGVGAWAALDLTARRDAARARIARAKGRGTLTPLRLALPAGQGADQLFLRLSADFQAIGVPLTRVAIDAPADLRLLDLVARTPRGEWAIDQLACGTGRGLCDSTVDAALAAARAEGDPVNAAAQFAAARARFAAAAIFVPLAQPVRWSLVREPAPGFAPNASGLHPLQALALRPT